MTWNNSSQAIVDHRRSMVAKWRLRQLTQREIAKKLAEEGIVNPKTDEPYDVATVNRDLKAIEAEWKQGALADIAQHKANHVAELREVRREAWKGAKPKLFYVLKSLEQEARVLGLEVEGTDKGIAAFADSFRLGAETMHQLHAERKRERETIRHAERMA